MTKLSIIVLNYNTRDVTIDCLKALFNFYDKEISNEFIEVIVVDNASVDNSVDFIKKENLKVKIIANKENYGFSKGNNIGVKEAQGKYVLFLNSDTRIQDKGFLRMVEFLDLNDRVAILGAKLENSDKSTQKSAGYFYNVFNLAILLFGGGKFGFLRKTPSRISRIDWVSGAALMVRRDIFKKIGGFEEKLFMYMEDMELCFRAKNKGYLTYYYPNISLMHIEGVSSNRTFAIVQIYKGILYFFKKYKPNWQYKMARFMLKTKSMLLVMIGRILNNKYLKETYSKTLEI